MAETTRDLETFGLLSAQVVHDVNNLLTIIVNYASFALEAGNTTEPPERDQWCALLADLASIRRAAERGRELTERLLAYGSHSTLSPEPLAVNEAMEESLDLLRGSFGAQISVTTHWDSGCPVVRMGRGEFNQIVVNLISNARDAMPTGGILTVWTTQDLSSQTVRVVVADSGTGIAPADLQRVFEPFHSTKPLGRGTGLGLTTVRDLVTAAGGKIDITSAPGRGTTVEVILPVTTPSS